MLIGIALWTSLVCIFFLYHPYMNVKTFGHLEIRKEG